MVRSFIAAALCGVIAYPMMNLVMTSAPLAMVIKKYEADIKEEAKRKLIGDNYRKAIEEQKLQVVGYPDIEEVQFARGQALQFRAKGVRPQPRVVRDEQPGALARHPARPAHEPPGPAVRRTGRQPWPGCRSWHRRAWRGAPRGTRGPRAW